MYKNSKNNADREFIQEFLYIEEYMEEPKAKPVIKEDEENKESMIIIEIL